jgi:hypothetical protein
VGVSLRNVRTHAFLRNSTSSNGGSNSNGGSLSLSVTRTNGQAVARRIDCPTLGNCDDPSRLTHRTRRGPRCNCCCIVFCGATGAVAAAARRIRRCRKRITVETRFARDSAGVELCSVATATIDRTTTRTRDSRAIEETAPQVVPSPSLAHVTHGAVRKGGTATGSVRSRTSRCCRQT